MGRTEAHFNVAHIFGSIAPWEAFWTRVYGIDADDVTLIRDEYLFLLRRLDYRLRDRACRDEWQQDARSGCAAATSVPAPRSSILPRVSCAVLVLRHHPIASHHASRRKLTAHNLLV